MNGDEFIRIAGRLAASPSADAATCRTAVSRAYYGAFHRARTLLDELGFRPPALANAHVFVQHYLIGSNQPAAYLAGSLLGELHGDRLRADYQLDNGAVENPRFAQTAVELSHRCLAALSLCQQEPSRSEVQRGLHDYHRRRESRGS